MTEWIVGIQVGRQVPGRVLEILLRDPLLLRGAGEGEVVELLDLLQGREVGEVGAEGS